MRVLLVDDEGELVSTIAERLSFRGIDADWATSGEDAIKKAATERYDLAVLDVKMPRISGIQLKGMLHVKYPDMKFIFMTGHGSEDDFRAGSSKAYYLVKPIGIEALVSKINEALKED
ncbi:MAG: response regulator [Deltaproteobacteria bacterium]|nr:response regulator [Deltaproteobacteria bacterium]MBW2080263.1 response regulator [Deltaproteobacteria bacterium]